MLVKCISARLNHVNFGPDANGKMLPKRIKPGDTFKVKSIPPEWKGLVVAVSGSEKVAVTNPAESDELSRLKAEYKEKAGKAAHHTWDAEQIAEKLKEL